MNSVAFNNATAPTTLHANYARRLLQLPLTLISTEDSDILTPFFEAVV